MNGRKINLGRRSLGVLVPDFHPSSIFPQERGFLSFFSLDQKCHCVDAGVLVPDFHPSSIFPRGRGFLSFFSLDQKCHCVGAWWVLLICKANFIEMRAKWATGYILKQEIPTFLNLLSGHVHLKCVVFCQCEGAFFSLSAHESLLFTRCKLSCYAFPAHISLVIPSYLPAVTPWTFLQWIYRLL